MATEVLARHEIEARTPPVLMRVGMDDAEALNSPDWVTLARVNSLEENANYVEILSSD